MAGNLTLRRRGSSSSSSSSNIALITDLRHLCASRAMDGPMDETQSCTTARDTSDASMSPSGPSMWFRQTLSFVLRYEFARAAPCTGRYTP